MFRFRSQPLTKGDLSVDRLSPWAFYYLPPRQRPGTGDIETPPSACPSVTFSFRDVTRIHIAAFYRYFADLGFRHMTYCKMPHSLTVCSTFRGFFSM